MARRPGSRGYYAAQFRHVFGRSLESAWADWIVAEKAFQLKNLERSASTRSRRHRDLTHARAGLGVARLLRPDTRSHLRRLQLSRRGRARRRARREDGRGRAHRTTQGADDLHRHVAGLRPGATASSTTPPTTAPTATWSRWIRPPAQTTLLQKDARIGELAFNKADRTLWGIRHLNGLCTHRPDAGALHRVDACGDVSLRHGGVRPRRVARRDEGRRPRSARSTASMDVRVFAVAALLKGDTTRGRSASISARRCRPASSSRPTAAFSTAARIYTGVSNVFRYDLATGETRGGEQHRDGVLPADPAGRRRR